VKNWFLSISILICGVLIILGLSNLANEIRDKQFSSNYVQVDDVRSNDIPVYGDYLLENEAAQYIGISDADSFEN
jgi:hypothetical protein